MDRRTVLKGISAAGALAPLPALALDARSAMQQAEFHARKLAEAMAAIPDEMDVTVHSGDAAQEIHFRMVGTRTPALRRDHHLQRFIGEASAADPSIVAWHFQHLPDHWTGVRFRCTAVSQEALAHATDMDGDGFGGDLIGFLSKRTDFVCLDGKAVL